MRAPRRRSFWFSSRDRRIGSRDLPAAADLECLEPRLPLATFLVTSTAAEGEGSLAAAIDAANANPGGDSILFAIEGESPLTVFVTRLPTITESVVIDATTQPGYVDRPLVLLRGVENQAGGGSAGLRLEGDRSVVRGLAFGRFAAGTENNGAAVTLSGSNHRVEASWFGVGLDGVSSEPNSTGILIASGSGHVIGGTSAAQRNLISGNNTGVRITADNHLVLGNWVGLDVSGSSPMPNATGIQIDGTGNRIGGGAAGEGNLISGNTAGVVITGTGNRLEGNRIGTDRSGTAPVANEVGVRIVGSANVVGGTAPEVGNVISGNVTGVLVRGDRNQLAGNRIGTDAEGNLPLGNTTGVHAVDGIENVIGGQAAAQRNVISANETGVLIESRSTRVEGNYFGVDPSGANPLGNLSAAIRILPGQNLNNRIGGTEPGAGNIFAATGGFALVLEGNGNFVQGNRFGRNADNPSSFANGGGIAITGANNRIGGTESRAGNVVSGNELGIRISGSQAGANVIVGNAIGVDRAGRAVGNRTHGIEIAAPRTTVGGSTPGAGNTIAANGGHGVWIHGSDARDNLVQGNQIGTDSSGSMALPNEGDGVRVENTASAANNLIGGTVVDEGNRIAFNRGAGVAIVQSAGAAEDSTGTQVRLNQIYENVGLGIDLGPQGAPDGITPNDPGDQDSGPNALQNFPELTAFFPGPTTRITGRLDSPAGVTYVVDFYSSATAAERGRAEGRRYLGSTLVGPDSLTFDVELATETQPLDFVTATATAIDTGHGTSEFSPLGTIEGTKRLDLLRDGATPDDLPLADFTVELYRDDGDGVFDATLDLLIDSAVTDDEGRYRFDAVRPGLHLVVDPPDDRYEQTAGGDQFPDVPFYRVEMVTHHARRELDFANYRIPRLGGMKVIDVDNNGVSAGDVPLPGWSVELYRDDGDGVFNANVDTLVETTVTDAQGRYEFSGMAPGDYFVVEVLAGDYEQTGGGDDFPAVPYYARTVIGGTEALDLDFANFDFPDFRGIKFIDITGDGPSSDDERHPGNVIQLWRDDGDRRFDADRDQLERIDATDLEGRYEFIRVVPGTYHVVDVVASNHVQTGGGDAFPQRPYYTITVENGVNREDLHFSNARTASVAGQLIADRTGDGFSSDDTPLVGGNVFVYRDSDGNRRLQPPTDERVATLTSDEQGAYRLEGLAPGRYFLTREPEARVRQTAGGDAFPLRSYFTVDLLSGQEVVGKDFASAPFHPTGLIARAMAAGDFDGDGDVDVVVVNERAAQLQSTGSVVMLINDGTGNFPAMRPIAISGRPQSILAADLDGNRFDDLILTTVGDGTRPSAPQNRVLVLYNAGDGNFFQQTVINNVGDGPIDAVAADVDADGDLDLAVASFRSNDVTVLLNQGRARFARMAPVAVGSQPVAIAAHHLNGDQAIDLVVADYRANSLSLLTNNGRGRFTRVGSVPTVTGPTDLAIADWDNDGRADVAVAGFLSDQVAIHYGLRAGAVADEGNRRTYVVGSSLGATRPSSVLPVDFDADGDVDLVAAATDVATAVVLENLGERVFTATSILPTAGGPQAVVADDFDGNQSPDIASTTIYRVFADIVSPDVSQGGVNVTYNRNVDIAVSISNNRDAVFPGERLSYTLRVRNNGPNRVEGVVVESEFPAEWTDIMFTSSIVGTGSGNTAEGQQEIRDVLQLDRGAEAVYVVTGTIDPEVRGLFQVAARATAPDHLIETNPANNRAADRDEVTTLVDVAVHTDVDLPDDNRVVIPPAEIRFTITASNAGPATATGVSIANQFELPAATRIAATFTNKGAFDLTTRRWTVGELAVGETVTLTVVVRVDALAAPGGEIRHRAFVTELTEVDADVSNNLSAILVRIGPIDEQPDPEESTVDDSSITVAASMAGSVVLAEDPAGPIDAQHPPHLPPAPAASVAPATPAVRNEPSPLTPTSRPRVSLRGDFNGDGSLDVAEWVDGRWWVHAAGTTTLVDWGRWSTEVEWLELRAVDLDGDGRTDIVGRTATGKWWIGRSTGQAFRNERLSG